MANFAEQLENETAIELAFLEYILYQSTVVRLDCARSLSNLAPHFDNLNEPSDSPIHGASINDFASGSLLSENNASSNNFHRSSSQNLSDYYENSSCSNSKKCKLDFVSMAATPLSQIGCENFKEIVKPRINASEECSILRENSEKHQIILDLNNKNSHSVAFEDLEKENQSIINTLQGDSGNVSINNQNASHEKIDSGQINPISETRTTNSHARKKTISNVSLDIVRLHKASNLFTLSMSEFYF